jgi:hypothetical protein
MAADTQEFSWVELSAVHCALSAVFNVFCDFFYRPLLLFIKN